MEHLKDILLPEPRNTDLPFSTELIHDVKNNFSIPIDFLHDKQLLSENIKNDVEINKVYEKVFGRSSEVSKCLHEKMGNYTTNNIRFLKDTQHIVNNTQRISKCSKNIWDENTKKLSSYWHDIRNPNFCGKYSFMEWSIFKPMNYSVPFLTILSLSNILSPLLFFIMPFILLMVPFVMLKIQGIPISTDKYYDILKHIAKNHFIGKALTQINNLSFTNIVQIFFYLCMYLLQVYNNVQSCRKYYNDIITVNENILLVKDHIKYSLTNFSSFKEISSQCKTYRPFVERCQQHMDVLKKLNDDLKDFNYKELNISNVFEFGSVLKHYYKIYDNEEYKNAIAFSIGFTEYLSHMQVLNCNVGNLINHAKFSTKKKTHVKKQYYPL